MTASTFPTTTMFDWYDRHCRSLPWRHRWPDLAPAYHVWLSEIMLQQTVVTTVIPYFLEFTRRWPDVCDLAAAEQDEVMAAWTGPAVGGTDLFRLYNTGETDLHSRLAAMGIWTRVFANHPSLIRLGLPPDDAGFARLTAALN